MRTARNAAVSAEINQLAQALANFKSKYGDYPPSRVFLAENGNYPSHQRHVDRDAGDITDRALASDADITLRPALPSGRCRPSASSSRRVSHDASHRRPVWYDFNGNGVIGRDALHPPGPRVPGLLPGGHPARRIRRRGHVRHDRLRQGPDQPVHATASPIGNAMYSANRQPPLFEFNAGRLFLDPNNLSNNGANPGHPRLLRLARQRAAGGRQLPPSISTPTSAPTATASTTPTTSISPSPTSSEADANRISVRSGSRRSSHGTATVYISPCAQSRTRARSTVDDHRHGHVPEPAVVPDHLRRGSTGSTASAASTSPHGRTSSASNPLPFDADQHLHRDHRGTTDPTIRQREARQPDQFQIGNVAIIEP